MREEIIPDKDGKGYTKVFSSGDVEFVNPIEHYRNVFVQPRISVLKDLMIAQKTGIPIDIIEKSVTKNAEKEWDESYKQILATEIPPNFISLLKSESKKDQVKLLRGQSLTTDQLLALIIRGFTEFGYVFSEYMSENYYGVDKKELPKLAKLNRETGEVHKVGKTELSDGQIKKAIEQRKVIIAKFWDKKDEWHCLLLTHRSIGEETWNGGQAHFHYISDKFGISREEVVERIKSGIYPSTSVHIGLTDYDKATASEEEE